MYGDIFVFCRGGLRSERCDTRTDVQLPGVQDVVAGGQGGKALKGGFQTTYCRFT